MKTVSVSELKARLSAHLRWVRQGGEVQILDRGVPIARLTGLSPTPDTDDAERRERLVAAGIVRPGTGDASVMLATPVPDIRVDLVGAVDDERSDRV